MVDVSEYIDNGIIEAYVMGLASPSERMRLEAALPLSPVLQQALLEFELKIEVLAMQHREPPPPGTWAKIADRIRELPAVREPIVERTNGERNGKMKEEYLMVQESSSTHLRVHKYWRVAFISIFVLSKILLALFIYYFIQYQHAEKDIRRLEQQVEKVK